MGHRNCLGGSYLRDTITALRLADELRDKFVLTWFDGGIDPAIIKPLGHSLAEHLEYITAELQTCQSPSLDVHITHDWNVMVIREGTFGVRYHQAGWPDYLEGIVLQQADAHRLLSYRDVDVKQQLAGL